MVLFIVGEGPNSLRARHNLAQICEDRLKGGYDLSVVDVLEDFESALSYGILVTPALVVEEPRPRVTVLGDLSDTEKLLKALRLH
mgnify:CR=1 FL=1